MALADRVLDYQEVSSHYLEVSLALLRHLHNLASFFSDSRNFLRVYVICYLEGLKVYKGSGLTIYLCQCDEEVQIREDGSWNLTLNELQPEFIVSCVLS